MWDDWAKIRGRPVGDTARVWRGLGRKEARERVPCRKKPVQMHESTRESWNDQLLLSPDFFKNIYLYIYFSKEYTDLRDKGKTRKCGISFNNHLPFGCDT